MGTAEEKKRKFFYTTVFTLPKEEPTAVFFIQKKYQGRRCHEE